MKNTGFELTTVVAIGTDCIDSYKSNYNTITTAPKFFFRSLHTINTHYMYIVLVQLLVTCQVTCIKCITTRQIALLWGIPQSNLVFINVDIKATTVVSSNPVHGEVYLIQHYVIKFISDLRQVSGFLRVLRLSPPIKLTDSKLHYKHTFSTFPGHQTKARNY
jgi:hypothetical protein